MSTPTLETDSSGNTTNELETYLQKLTSSIVEFQQTRTEEIRWLKERVRVLETAIEERDDTIHQLESELDARTEQDGMEEFY